MGTVIDLLIVHDSADDLLTEIIKRLERYEQRFSANSSDSELMTINKQAGIQPVSVHPELYELIKIGVIHSCAPDSNLNIAMGPLVQAWRIGFNDARVPSDDEIQKLLQITNPENIILNDKEQSVFLKQKGMLIDLGALAKGYIADLLIEYLKSMKVSSALINLGGNIVGLGPSRQLDKAYWNIGIQNPLLPRNQYMATLKIANQSVVTSGIYERSLSSDGKTYHHILDSHTGYPLTTDIASFTIQSDQSVDGEIWTTRLYGKTAQDVIEQLNQLDGIEGLLIKKDGTILYSNGLKK